LETREERVEKASRIKTAQFEKYAPLIKDMRQDKCAAMSGFLVINLRRTTMLLMAMFVRERQWLQLHVFIALNFLSLSL